MKTKVDILNDIQAIMDDCKKLNDFNPAHRKEKDKAKKRIAMLNTCILIIKHNTSESDIRQIKQDYDWKINKLEDKLHQWVKGLTKDQLDRLKNPREYYYENIARTELKEIKHIKEQREKINYILV